MVGDASAALSQPGGDEVHPNPTPPPMTGLSDGTACSALDSLPALTLRGRMGRARRALPQSWISGYRR